MALVDGVIAKKTRSIKNVNTHFYNEDIRNH
jgi:hypothetical protein